MPGPDQSEDGVHADHMGVRTHNTRTTSPNFPQRLQVTGSGQQGMRSVQTSPARLSAASAHSSRRDESDVDANFFSSVEPNPPQPTDEEPIKKYSTEQSRQLPPWAWFIVAQILGIKLHPGEKVYIGTGLHFLTLLLAFMLVATFMWYTVYDIVSRDTRSTVLTGLASVGMIIFWSSLGVYGNKLATKLFSCRAFVTSVRMHSKTIFKLSAAVVLVIVTSASVGLNNYSTYLEYSDAKCVNITVPAALCRTIFATQCCYSFLLLVWNVMVGVVMLSVCRTHTIGIRRFIGQLEADGRLYESYRRHSFFQAMRGSQIAPDEMFSPSTEDEYLWDDDLTPLSDDYQALPPATNQVSFQGSAPPSPSRTRAHSYPGPPHLFPDHPPPPNQDDASGVMDPDDKPLLDLASDGGVERALGTTNFGAELIQSGGVSQVLHHSRPAIVIRQSSVASKDMAEASGIGSLGTNQSRDNLTEADQQPWSSAVPHSPKSTAAVSDGTMRPKTLIKPDPPSQTSRSSHQSIRVQMGSPYRAQSMASFGSVGSHTVENESMGPRMLSVDDIFLCYWRINCRLRMSSLVLQRWLTMWVIFILVYGSGFIVHWISHEATLFSIAQLVLPLLILPLLTSAYGEVNNEGRRMLKCVCPTEERVQMMLMLIQQPLEMTVFGFPISYSSIGTFVGALTIAFCSKIVLEEIQL